MPYVNDFIPQVTSLLGNRADVVNYATQAIIESIIELSDNYPFEELRETGPLVQLTPGVSQYSLTQFLAAPVGGLQHNLGKPLSWYLYYNYSATPGVTNTGYNLVFRDIEDLETLINVQQSIPQFWSWLGGFLYLAATPIQDYTTYLRYQFLHPFNAVYPYPYNSDLSDVVLLPATWYDIICYAAAERIAFSLRMSDVADRMHMKLHGDPKEPGSIGLIQARTSQTTKNQSRTTRSVRPMMSRY